MFVNKHNTFLPIWNTNKWSLELIMTRVLESKLIPLDFAICFTPFLILNNHKPFSNCCSERLVYHSHLLLFRMNLFENIKQPLHIKSNIPFSTSCIFILYTCYFVDFIFFDTTRRSSVLYHNLNWRKDNQLTFRNNSFEWP